MRTQPMVRLLALLAGLGSGSAGSWTEAGIMIFTDPVEFRKALGPAYVEGLDGVAALQPPLANPIHFQDDTFGFTIAGDFGGMRRTDVNGDIGLAALTGTDVLVLDRFTGPAQAVGGWFSVVTYDLDTPDRNGTFRVTATDGFTTLVHKVDRPESFVGFLSDTAVLRSLTVARSSGSGTGLVNGSGVILGARLASAPEPGTLAGLLSGTLAGLLEHRRRSRRLARAR